MFVSRGFGYSTTPSPYCALGCGRGSGVWGFWAEKPPFFITQAAPPLFSLGPKLLLFFTLSFFMRITPGFDNPRSVSACVPEAFCTINFTFSSIKERGNIMTDPSSYAINSLIAYVEILFFFSPSVFFLVAYSADLSQI